MIKKQGASGLPEVTDNINGTQSCMCFEATYAADFCHLKKLTEGFPAS